MALARYESSVAAFGKEAHFSIKNVHDVRAYIDRLEAALQLYAGLGRDGIKWEPLNDNGGVARAALAGEKKDG